MKIIPYHRKYRREILALWNQTLTTDPLSEERFLEKIILDENFDPNHCLIAINNEQKVLGFIWAVVREYPYGDKGLEQGRGWIAAIFVDEKSQNQGIGTALVQTTEKCLREQGAENITLGAYSPHYLFPGVDTNNYPNAKPFFEAMSYEVHGEAVSMERSLFDFKKSSAYLELYQTVKDKGYTLSSFTLEDTEELIKFLENYFEGGWSQNVKQAILKQTAKDTILVLRDKNREIAGYAQRAIDGSPNRFGPFGVRNDLRGEGLGAVLFNEMLFDMLRKGINHAYFLWTSGAAQKFYERNGMHVYRSYALMRKDL